MEVTQSTGMHALHQWRETLDCVIAGCAILMPQSFCQKFNSITDGSTRVSLSGGIFSAKLLPDWTDTVVQLLRNNTDVGPGSRYGVCPVWITPSLSTYTA